MTFPLDVCQDGSPCPVGPHIRRFIGQGYRSKFNVTGIKSVIAAIRLMSNKFELESDLPI